MMTNRRLRAFAVNSIIGMGVLISTNGIEIDAVVGQSNQTRYTETPDPYFQSNPVPRASSPTNPAIKPIRVPTKQRASSPTDSLWSAPKTITNPHISSNSKSNKSVNWKAPNWKAPNWKAPNWEAPSTAVAAPLNKVPSVAGAGSQGSIIRERSVTPNGVKPNNNSFDFGTTNQSGISNAATDVAKSGRNFKVVTPEIAQSEAKTKPTQLSTPSTGGSIFNDSNAFGEKLAVDSTPQANQINTVSYNRTPDIAPHSTSRIISQEEFKTFEPGKVLALVGGEPVFVGDLMFEINQVIEKFIGGAPEDVKAKRRQEMIPQVLPRFVEAKILFLGSLQELPEGADIKGVLKQAEDEFDESQLEKVLKNSGLKSVNEFDAYLRAQGSSLRKIRQSWAQEQLTKYFLSRAVNIDNEVTHQEMLDSYRKNIETYAQPAKAKWEQIMIRFDRAGSRSKAKKKLVELGDNVVYGANFATVAKKESHGFLASQGGQHDWTTKGALVLSEIDNAIFSLPVGDLSDIIETSNGFHIVRVIERSEAMTKPFLEAQVEIKKRILDEKRKKAFDEHVKKLKREIPVEYYLNEDVKLPSKTS
jgi:parvulin-like peptidyl-prolyl isomerase